MNTLTSSSSPPAAAVPESSPSALGSWNRFWFTPADPTLVALIRICCGAVALYTLIAYTGDLQEFFGTNAWWDLDSRGLWMRTGPVMPLALNWEKPPILDLDTLPREQQEYAKTYFGRYNSVPPFPFPKDEQEAKAIDDYIGTWGVDPRTLVSKGTPIWSVWFDITEPGAMMAVHLVFIAIMFLFTIGFCTRITSVLAWFTYLNYIHRSPIQLFGVDTMTVIVMMYLMMAPCGAVLSVDRLLARWWAIHGLRVRARCLALWQRLRGRPQTINLAEVPLGAPLPPNPEPSVAANVALRLLQIHVCIIYAAAGLSKLQGAAWWEGRAVWGTLANFEFAPMQYPMYRDALRSLTKNKMVLEVFLTCSSFFTLFFEISYCFLIWNRSTRWVILAMALLLHGVIGIFMGLKTFSLIMLAMNMAFLPPNAVQWMLQPLAPLRSGGRPAPPEPPLKTTPIPVAKEPVAAGVGLGKHFKRKR